MSTKALRNRRIGAVFIILAVVVTGILLSQDVWQPKMATQTRVSVHPTGSAADLLATIPIKGRAPKTGYARTQFGNGWSTVDGCDTRDIILHRDMTNTVVASGCKVISGTLAEPYTGKTIAFKRGAETSSAVQIDHVVAIGDAWQKGAQQLPKETREKLYNDPLELLAVDGPANQQKSDGDAATWLPPNKAFRCQYVSRQIAVKSKYDMWMTQVEHDAIAGVLATCPGQSLPLA